jgi:hypothetical protein
MWPTLLRTSFSFPRLREEEAVSAIALTQAGSLKKYLTEGAVRLISL